MKKNTIFYLSIIVCFIINLLGCGGVKKGDESINGRFIEKEYSIPNLKFIFDLELIKDNKLVLIGEDYEGNEKKYISKDNGQNWSEEEFSFSENGEIILASMYKDNSLALIYNEKDTENYKGKIYSSNGENTLNLLNNNGNNKLKLFTTENGDILEWQGNSIIKYDPISGDIKSTYEIKEGNILSVCTNSNFLIVCTDKSIIKYDLNDDSKLKEIDELKKYIDDRIQIFSSNKENEIYVLNNNKLIKYNIANKSIKEIMNVSEYSLSDTNIYVSDFVEISENEFLILYCGFNNGTFSLCNYSYSNEKASKELNVYSLYENELINQCIVQYKKNNSDIKINYTIGITEDNNRSYSEAIKVLNSEMMSGNGPDILILDNINYESYVNEGILEDISEIIDTKKETLFSGIIESYYENDKLYMIPLRFKIPTIIGNKEDISNINNLSSLAKEIENNISKKSGQVLDIYSIEDVINLLFYTSSNEFIINDSINETELKKFLEETKKVYKSAIKKTPSLYRDEYNEQKKLYIEENGDEYGYSRDIYLERITDPLSLISSNILLDIGNIDSFNTLSKISTVMDVDRNIGYKYWSSGESNAFIPKEIVAINSKGKNKEIGKEFINALIDKKYQEIDKETGFPINREAILEQYSKNVGEDNLGGFGFDSGNGELKEYDFIWPVQEDYDNLISIIENLNFPTNMNTDILEATIKGAEYYFKDKKDLEETIKYIKEELKIYLSE